MTIRYTITPTSITVLLHGKNWQIDKSHVNFIAVRDKLLDESGSSSEERMVAELTPLVNIPVFIATISTGRVQISGDAVMFDGAPVHGHIAERLLTMVRKGRNPRPLMRFLERLQRAPIKNVADQFLHWLEKSNMPLTADGCFVAYKYVDDDLKDSWTHTIDNSPGAVIPRLEPNRINTDRNQTCAASGYHFCSFGYLGGNRPVMLLKIAPEDVCSFPENEEAKGRCLFYEIINRIPDDAVASRVIEGGDLIYTGMYAIDPAPFRTPDTQPAVAEAMSPGGLGAAESWDAEGYEDDEDEDGGVDPADVQGGGFQRAHRGGLLNTKPKKRKRSSQEKNASAKEKWLARLKGTKVSGKRLTETSIKALVEKHGLNEMARRTGIPRTTLQGWVK